MKEMDEILKLLEELRGKKGCPWDRKQTIESLKEDLREEYEEVIQAIDKKDYENLREEIGDLIWTLLLMVQIASEERHFDARDVLKYTRDKIIRRHPHVFGKSRWTTWRNGKKSSTCFQAKTAEDAIKIFNKAKEREKNGLRRAGKKTE